MSVRVQGGVPRRVGVCVVCDVCVFLWWALRGLEDTLGGVFLCLHHIT